MFAESFCLNKVLCSSMAGPTPEVRFSLPPNPTQAVGSSVNAGSTPVAFLTCSLDHAQGHAHQLAYRLCTGWQRTHVHAPRAQRATLCSGLRRLIAQKMYVIQKGHGMSLHTLRVHCQLHFCSLSLAMRALPSNLGSRNIYLFLFSLSRCA